MTLSRGSILPIANQAFELAEAIHNLMKTVEVNSPDWAMLNDSATLASMVGQNAYRRWSALNDEPPLPDDSATLASMVGQNAYRRWLALNDRWLALNDDPPLPDDLSDEPIPYRPTP